MPPQRTSPFAFLNQSLSKDMAELQADVDDMLAEARGLIQEADAVTRTSRVGQLWLGYREPTKKCAYCAGIRPAKQVKCEGCGSTQFVQQQAGRSNSHV
jgi:hypothetical protein